MKDLDERSRELEEKRKEFRSAYSDEEYIERLESAIRIIENIALHQEELPKHLTTEKEDKLHSSIMDVYKISHVARLPGCMGAHESWEDDFQQMKEAK